MRSTLRLCAALTLGPLLAVGCSADADPTPTPTTEATPAPSPTSASPSPTATPSPTVDTAPACAPDAETTATIEAVVRNANTEPLIGWVAETVDVVLAASEGYGPRPGDQAVLDFSEFLYGGSEVMTAEFDFSVPEATLATYRSGGYAEYFSPEALIARATDGRVIAFSFDCDGLIDTMLLVPNEDWLS